MCMSLCVHACMHARARVCVCVILTQSITFVYVLVSGVDYVIKGLDFKKVSLA